MQLIENSGGISAMMVIQFSKETHFRQRQQREGAVAVRRSVDRGKGRTLSVMWRKDGSWIWISVSVSVGINDEFTLIN